MSAIKEFTAVVERAAWPWLEAELLADPQITVLAVACTTGRPPSMSWPTGRAVDP